jgi:hypothetical protein
MEQHDVFDKPDRDHPGTEYIMREVGSEDRCLMQLEPKQSFKQKEYIMTKESMIVDLAEIR